MPMNLLTLLGTLESNLTRELVGTNDGDTISYTADTTKTVTINTNTTYSNVNRLCLITNDTTTNMYIASYDYKKLSKINIANITNITIT